MNWSIQGAATPGRHVALQCGREEKLPHEGNNDGVLVSRLPSPYNKVQLYMCPIIYAVLYHFGRFIR